MTTPKVTLGKQGGLFKAGESQRPVVGRRDEKVGCELLRCQWSAVGASHWATFKRMCGLNGAGTEQIARGSSINTFSFVCPVGAWRLETWWSPNLVRFKADAWTVMEQNVEMIVAGAKLVREDFEFAIVVDHWEHILLKKNETFACVPDDAAVQVRRFRIARCIKTAKFTCANDFVRKHEKVAKDLVEPTRQERVVLLNVSLLRLLVNWTRK
jgi:hypothetical protein